MNKRTWLNIFVVITALAGVIALSGCFAGSDEGSRSDGKARQASGNEGMNHGVDAAVSGSLEDTNGRLTGTIEVLDGSNATLTAQAGELEIASGKKLPVWTFNNSVPGPQIRARVGETIKVTLKNELEEPVSIHWHGYPVPNEMDGIPGVTQDAVLPGKSFTYEFKATIPGTYWYHSHQDSVNQVDKGLYGSLVVEDPKDKADRDYTLVLDEWMNMEMSHSMDATDSMDGEMKGMEHREKEQQGDGHDTHGAAASSDASSVQPMAGHDMSMYDMYTINGKMGDSIQPLKVKKGEKVRLRFVNAGFLSHQIHIHGHEFKVVASDGQPINSPALIQNQLLSIAPGERYDVEFIADNPGKWLIEEHGSEQRIKQMRTFIEYEGETAAASKDVSDSSVMHPTLDLAKYGEMANAKFSLNEAYDQDVKMDLNTEVRAGKTVYTINGKVFPDTDKIKVNKGERVKVTFVNQSKSEDHPMHLHGHFFQVLSKNGKPIAGAPIMKDTLNVKPGETIVVAFEADNPGDWMFHCHDLHHAADGMVTDVHYLDYKKSYVPDPTVSNIPE
ncbi:multicopper oxidase family protein [Paenibacillus sp. OSY-SE]|uniref:multicopper oxidase family protein n=1 Tax=Paenibacillus sp. OSY-SE TaxID=1196323 RepID=UPI0002DF3C5B|nr:multicopper oxidase family protein [Paenibacillus sp. OSY-SE]